MCILFLFLDGVGIGARDETNPFTRAQLPVLRELLGGLPFLDAPRLENRRACVMPLDANLGVAGLPQSGTGQTTLLTGINAAEQLGEHYGPYPDARLLALLNDNLFHRLQVLGKRVAFANAYPPIFFERMARGTDRRSAMAQAAGMAHVPYRTRDDLAHSRAVSMSLTNERWPNHHNPPPIITPFAAGQNLARLANDHDFTLFEFALTDIAGHRPARMSAVTILERLDEFLGGVLDGFNLRDSLLLITSDHGNIEDSTTKQHTRNPVPAIIVGVRRREFAEGLRSLVGVTPAIVKWVQT
jgi:hypothetical protein